MRLFERLKDKAQKAFSNFTGNVQALTNYDTRQDWFRPVGQQVSNVTQNIGRTLFNSTPIGQTYQGIKQTPQILDYIKKATAGTQPSDYWFLSTQPKSEAIQRNQAPTGINIQPVGNEVRDYFSNVGQSALNTIESAARLTPPYQAYRAVTNQPSTALSDIWNLGTNALSTRYQMSPIAPIMGATWGGVKEARQGGNIEDILQAQRSGVIEQPGFGEAFSDDPKTQNILNLAYLAFAIGQQPARAKLKEIGVDVNKLNNAYSTLGIKPGTSPKQARQAYLNLAQTSHPDIGGTEQAMSEINKAYQAIEKSGGLSRFLSGLGLGGIKNISQPISGLLPSNVGETPIQPLTQSIESILQSPTPPAPPTPKSKSAIITQPTQTLDSLPAFAPTGKTGLGRTWDALTTSSKRVIEKSGPAGKKIVDILNTTNEEVDLTTGKQISQMKMSLDDLNKQEKLTFADAVEGKIEPISDKQKQAIETWNQISKDIYNRAQEQGLDIGFIEQYFPHHVILENKGQTKGSLGRRGQRRYGNLEMARQTDAPYDKDPSVLLDYIKKANQRIIEVKNYGKADEKLYKLANKTKDPAQTAQYLDQILRKNQGSELDELSQGILSYNTITKLKPTTSILNLTQNLSTLLRTDPESMFKATAKIITNPQEAIHNAIKAGELDARSERILQDYAGSGNLASKWIRFIGMEGTEKFNRIIAVNAGMDYFNKLNKQALAGNKAALREIERLGMKVNDNSIKAGRKVSQETQFATEPGELPYGWKTALGKILAQFKSFAYKQTGFVINQTKRVWSEANKGNFKPFINALMAYGLAAPIVGEVVADAKALFANKKRDTKGTKRYLENMLAATSLGLLDEIGALTGKYGEKGVIGTLFGPTVSDIVGVGETIANIGSDDKYDRRKAYRNILKPIPLVGQTIANTIVPNSYIDNLLGPNVGLGESDKQTYQDIKSVSPQKAEVFKQARQAERDQKDKGFFENLFSNKDEFDLAQTPTTREEAEEYKKRVLEMIKAGALPDPEIINNALFSGKKATSNTFEDRKEVYSELYKILGDEEFPLPEAVENQILEAAGANKKDYEFYKLSKVDQTSRLERLLPILGDLSDPENFKELALLRRRVGGNEVLSNGMIDDLYRYGLISKSQKNFLKNLQYDELKQEFYGKKSGSGSGKLSYSQLAKIYKPIAPKFEKIDVIDGSTSKIIDLIAQIDAANKPNKMQRTIDEILAGPKINTQGSEELWFIPAS